MHSPSTRWQLGLALSLLATILWALLPIALKSLLLQMDAMTITWYRFLSATLVIGLIIILKGRKPKFQLLRGRLLFLVVVAIVGLTYNYVCFLLGLQSVTPSSAEVMIQLAPIFLLIGSLVIFKERFSFWQWMGLCLFLFGIGLFFNHRWREMFDGLGAYSIGFLWIILASMLWATYALTQKALLSSFPSSHALFMIYCVGSFLLFPNVVPAQIIALDKLAIALLLFCCLNTLVAYGAFAEALAHWEASRVSAVLTLTPLLTIVFMFGIQLLYPHYIDIEPLNVLSITGAILVVVGSMLTALARSKTAKEGAE